MPPSRQTQLGFLYRGEVANRRDATDAPSVIAPRAKWSLYHGDVLDVYDQWPTPSMIISDGAYGVGGFHGDPRTLGAVTEWYEPHVEAWTRKAHPATTLWFWNTEIGWANVHPILVAHDWEYVQAIIWDKGIPHIAGNVNGDTIRQFPVVTEICIFYRRKLLFQTAQGRMTAKEWLRHEWQRAGLALHLANEACGVRNAATRKYLTQDWLWYFPPPDMMQRLLDYANKHGKPDGRPYFSLNGRCSLTASEWADLRHTWTHEHAVTNVWAHPPLNGDERFKGNGVRSAPRVYRPSKNATVHLNQKPVGFMRRIISACTRPNDVVWEPFGGLCSGSVAAIELGRQPFAAEKSHVFYSLARRRLTAASRLNSG